MNENRVYINPEWESLLSTNRLNSFEDFWTLDIPAVDEGNFGRGQAGWSRVCIHNLETETGQARRMVIKRQSNYRTRTLNHPLCGIPTFIKEFDFIRNYEELGVPALKAVYCATRRQGKELQAILITEYLDKYRPLEDILGEWQEQGTPLSQRKPVIQNVAKLIALLHQQGLEHRCLFPKHIFVTEDTDSAPACLIDLEKTRSKPWSFGRRVRDLTALARRSPSVSTRDRLLFLQLYVGMDQLDSAAKKLWSQIRQRVEKKRS